MQSCPDVKGSASGMLKLLNDVRCKAVNATISLGLAVFVGAEPRNVLRGTLMISSAKQWQWHNPFSLP